MDIPLLKRESSFAPAVEAVLAELPSSGGWKKVAIDLGKGGGYSGKAISVEIDHSLHDPDVPSEPLATALLGGSIFPLISLRFNHLF